MSEKRHRQRDRVGIAEVARTSIDRSDTIVAIATPPGRSAVSVIRLSGASATQIAKRCVSVWPASPRTLIRCAVHAPDDPSRPIDDGMIVVFTAPRSYTGETVVEIHAHGGTYIPPAIQAALVAAGARPARAGEFTERATQNGKFNLVVAEAIGELIDARTRASHRAAMQGLSGMLSRQYEALRNDAIEAEALIAYDIDFPDEDHGPVASERIDAAATSLIYRITRLLATQPAVVLAREGAVVVLAGPPNAGKSSLLNALIGEARVIVSDEPGTTRDAVEVLLDADPWPIRLVDTAGLRDDAALVERLGIEVSERYLRGADTVVACAESAQALVAAMRRIMALTNAPIIGVLTKADIGTSSSSRANSGAVDDWLTVSTVNGQGIRDLHDRIAVVVAERAGIPSELSPSVASARQRASLETAVREIELFRSAWNEGKLPAIVAATHLSAAVGALDHLIGAIDVSEVFSRVFATFCVGK